MSGLEPIIAVAAAGAVAASTASGVRQARFQEQQARLQEQAAAEEVERQEALAEIDAEARAFEDAQTEARAGRARAETLDRAEAEARERERRLRQVQASERARFAATGLDPNSGSGGAVLRNLLSDAGADERIAANSLTRQLRAIAAEREAELQRNRFARSAGGLNAASGARGAQINLLNRGIEASLARTNTLTSLAAAPRGIANAFG